MLIEVKVFPIHEGFSSTAILNPFSIEFMEPITPAINNSIKQQLRDSSPKYSIINVEDLPDYTGGTRLILRGGIYKSISCSCLHR